MARKVYEVSALSTNGGNSNYDIVVIGAGASGQRAAIAAAKADKRVLLIENREFVGGTCINTGTIPSKSLREAVLYLSGWRERTVYGASYAVKRNITMHDLLLRAEHVVRAERDVMEAQVYRNGIDLIYGVAQFVDPFTLEVRRNDGNGVRSVRAANIIVATGTESAQVASIRVDGHHIFSSETIMTLDTIPRTLAVVGAGVIGCEYASIFATLGVRVTLIDARPQLLPFVDSEIIDALIYHLRDHDVTMRLGEVVKHSEVLSDGMVRTILESGKEIVTEKALHSIGRIGATADLNLPAAAISADDRGRLTVNEFFQTKEQSHIYAVGDVIGFPALASTSMEQGRLAALHASGLSSMTLPASVPYGIYTIPEMSLCGHTEAELTTEGVPYEIGKASYREIARGQIIGDQIGTLKLLFHQKTRRLLGVHIIGEGASEIIHVGQAVLAFGGSIDYFVNTVFNYPTLSECYKVAALNGFNRLGLSAQDALTGDVDKVAVAS